MEKRNNKKLFAIIGGSVLAFVLTIALSVSITLAYFGDSASKNTTVKMDAAVTLNQETTKFATVANGNDVLPGEAVNLDLAIKLTSTPKEGAYLAMKVTLAATKGGQTITDLPSTLTLANGTTWTLHNNIYYYTTEAVTGADTVTKAAVLQTANTTDGANFKGGFIVSPTLTDEQVAGAEMVITAKIAAIQGQLFYTEAVTGGTIGTPIDAPTIEQVVALQAFDSLWTA